MSAEQNDEVWFEIEIKDGADLDYFRWKSIQQRINELAKQLHHIAKQTNERTPPYNYLLKVRFTLIPGGDMKKFMAVRSEARELLTPKEYHDSLTEAETRRLER